MSKITKKGLASEMTKPKNENLQKTEFETANLQGKDSEILAEIAKDVKKLEDFVNENTLLFVDISATKYYKEMDSTTVKAICELYNCKEVKTSFFTEIPIKIKNNSILTISITEIVDNKL